MTPEEYERRREEFESLPIVPTPDRDSPVKPSGRSPWKTEDQARQSIFAAQKLADKFADELTDSSDDEAEDIVRIAEEKTAAVARRRPSALSPSMRSALPAGRRPSAAVKRAVLTTAHVEIDGASLGLAFTDDGAVQGRDEGASSTSESFFEPDHARVERRAFALRDRRRERRARPESSGGDTPRGETLKIPSERHR